MKYISLLIVLALMIWTWSLATSERSFELQQHKNVEAGVEEDIRAFIQRKYPATSDLHCPQLYTEVVKPSIEMVVHFRCLATGAIQGDIAEQTFEGQIALKSDDGFYTWSETGGHIRSPEVRFKDGLKITGDKNAAPSTEPVAEPVQEAAPAKAAPTHSEGHK